MHTRDTRDATYPSRLFQEEGPPVPEEYTLVLDGVAQEGDRAWVVLQGWLKIPSEFLGDPVSHFEAVVRRRGA